ncbi:MAG: FMN-binding negative transcriptional regulator [Flavobacteriales bacterium]|nr:FMN-binding negative transcriptional regulator [Flavobacteriales bacterium]
MYDLPYHKENDPKIVQAFIKQYPFAFLSGCTAQGIPVATQVPLFLEKDQEKQILSGHIMKGTAHHKAFLENQNVLAIFTGKHTYVSGTWYSNPNTPSTWNYMSVHMMGKIRFVNEAGLENILRKTSAHFENDDLTSPTVFDNLPESFKERVMHAIVGFEISVTQVDTVFKLSQDRDRESYNNIIKMLKLQGDDSQEIAREMERRLEQLFPDVE